MCTYHKRDLCIHYVRSNLKEKKAFCPGKKSHFNIVLFDIKKNSTKASLGPFKAPVDNNSDIERDVPGMLLLLFVYVECLCVRRIVDSKIARRDDDVLCVHVYINKLSTQCALFTI